MTYLSYFDSYNTVLIKSLFRTNYFLSKSATRNKPARLQLKKLWFRPFGEFIKTMFGIYIESVLVQTNGSDTIPLGDVRKRYPQSGGEFVHCGQRGSSDANVRTFWCKNHRIFRNLWCVRTGKGVEPGGKAQIFAIVRTPFMDFPLQENVATIMVVGFHVFVIYSLLSINYPVRTFSPHDCNMLV